jgi:hypothetical protein
MSTTDFRLNRASLSQFAQNENAIYPATVYQPIGPRQPLITEATTLSVLQLRQARDSYLLVDTDTGGAYTLTVGTDDTPAVAKDLQSVLGLQGTGDQCVLRFVCGNIMFRHDVLLNSASGAGTNVQVTLRGATVAANTLRLFDDTNGASTNSFGTVAMVEVTAENVSDSNAVIVFDIVLPAMPPDP